MKITNIEHEMITDYNLEANWSTDKLHHQTIRDEKLILILKYCNKFIKLISSFICFFSI
jgi:hypothetical protein